MPISKTLLQRVIQKTTLAKAWREISARKPLDAHGSDDQTIADFSRNRPQNLASIRDQIQAGTYRFSPLISYHILKRSGGQRELKIPTIRDRVVLRAIHLRLNTHRRLRGVRNNETNFAYRPRITMRHLASKINQLRPVYTWIMTADIVEFFDKINHDTAIECLEALTGDTTISELIRDSLSVPTTSTNSPPSTYGSSEDYDEKTGLPQGLAISPALSNIVLLDFDRLASRKSGFRVLRYADDLITFCKTREDVPRAHEHCSQVLGNIGLSIRPIADGKSGNIDKASQVYRIDNGFDFVGLEYRGHTVKPSKEKLAEFEDKISSILREEEKKGASAIYRRIHLFTLGWFGVYGPLCDAEALHDAARRADCLVLDWMHGKFKTLRMAEGNQTFTGGRRKFLSPQVTHTATHLSRHRKRRRGQV